MAAKIHLWLVFATLVLMLMVVSVSVEGSPTGCEWYNASVVKCHNRGTIENETYIDVGGVQIANAPDRFGWAHYELGIFWWSAPNVSQKIPFDFSSADMFIDSDNSTYWRVFWNVSMQQGAKKATLEYSYYQALYDDLVNSTLQFHTVAGFAAFTRNISLYRLMKNVDIDLDGDYDVLNLEDSDVGYGFYLNQSYEQWFPNLTDADLHVGDMDTSHGIQWRWEEDKHYQAWYYPMNGSNGKVAFFREFTPSPAGFGDNKTKTVTHWWIDVDPCTETRPAGCVVQSRNFVTSDGDYVSDGDGTITGHFYWRWWCPNFLGCGAVPPFQTCNPYMTFSGGCYIVGYDNTTAGNGTTYFWTNDTTQDNPYLQIDNATTLQSHMDEMNIDGKGYTQNFTIFCGENSPSDITFYGCLDITADACEVELSGDDDSKDWTLDCAEEWQPPAPPPALAEGAWKPIRLLGSLFNFGWWL